MSLRDRLNAPRAAPFTPAKLRETHDSPADLEDEDAHFTPEDLAELRALPLRRNPIPARPTLAELRRMPREQRQVILAAAAKLAEQDYHSDKELTGFEAFSEEERDDD